MKNKRIYIAQNETGVIHGVKVRAKLLTNNTKYNIKCECPCADCALKNKNICFVVIGEKRLSLPTRPACFGNDEDNLLNMPLIYVNEK